MNFHSTVFLFISAGIIMSASLVIYTNMFEKSLGNQFLEKSVVQSSVMQDYIAKKAATPYKVPVTNIRKYSNQNEFCNDYCSNQNCVIEPTEDEKINNVFC